MEAYLPFSNDSSKETIKQQLIYFDRNVSLFWRETYFRFTAILFSEPLHSVRYRLCDEALA